MGKSILPTAINMSSTHIILPQQFVFWWQPCISTAVKGNMFMYTLSNLPIQIAFLTARVAWASNHAHRNNNIQLFWIKAIQIIICRRNPSWVTVYMILVCIDGMILPGMGGIQPGSADHLLGSESPEESLAIPQTSCLVGMFLLLSCKLP